ncbi:hypothetical protein [Ekhidna sp.]
MKTQTMAGDVFKRKAYKLEIVNSLNYRIKERDHQNPVNAMIVEEP